MKEPAARVRSETDERFGIRREDPYGWMSDRDDPEVHGYLEAENAWTESVMGAESELRQELYDELLGRIQEDDASVPTRIDDNFYYTRTETGRAYPIFCRRSGSLEAPEEILLDVNGLADGHEYFDLGVVEFSPDHGLLAYSYDTRGDEVYNLVIKELSTGSLLPDRLEGTYDSMAWAADGRSFLYNVLDASQRPHEIRHHRLGSDATDDRVVHHEPDAAFYASVAKSRSRSFIFILLRSNTTSEVLYLPADEPGAEPVVFQPRITEVEYHLEHRDDEFWVLTNEHAKNYRVLTTPTASTDRESWREVIPHRPEVKIESLDVFRTFAAVVEREDGLKRLRIRHLEEGWEREVELPGGAGTVRVGENPRYEATELRFQFTSLVVPTSVYDHDVATGESILRKRQEVLGGFDSGDYETYRIEATAEDGRRVPISVAHRKGLTRDGASPCLLYGYGAYGITIDPSFSSHLLTLLDRGFVYAIAHVRGGGFLGEPWHDDGKLLRKRNSFSDFVAAAELLTEEGLTASDRLVARGGSAGGLLVGAALNLRPDLFSAVLAHVPFVDVVNTMLDPGLPLTVTEYEEWGDPVDEEHFHYMLSYSPYDNVRPAEYPHLLVTAGLNDPRVQYWEPAKWVAKLRAMKQGRSHLLLKTDMGAGHGGPSGRYGFLEERAFEYAFLLGTLGLGDREPQP